MNTTTRPRTIASRYVLLRLDERLLVMLDDVRWREREASRTALINRALREWLQARRER